MIIIVNPHDVKIKTSEKVNENEYNITKCEFEFSEEYTDDLVKVALFTNSAGTYKQIIFNNECNIPAEILEKNESTILGVYSYKEENEELILRYSPEPIKFFISKGSYIANAENSEPITPSELEQYQQALQNGLNELESAVEQAENLDIDVNKVGDTATVTITNKEGTSKSVDIKDGAKGEKGDTGANGKDGEDYVITSEDYQEIANIVEEEVDIPTKLSDLQDDSTHRTVTDDEKSTWNGKVSQTVFENSQTVQDNAINNINNEIDAFFKKTVSGTEIYLKQTLNWKMKLKINGNNGGVTGNNTINILGKNVYNKNTPTEHIYYDDTGSPQVDNTRDFINIDIPVFDKFVISYGGKFGGASFIRVIQYDDNNNFVKRSLISTNNQAITTESNTARILVSVNAGTSDYFTNLQIERGEIPTAYSEYQSQSYPINLGNIILNENDYIYKDNGNWYTKISGTDTQITDNNLIEQLNTMNNNTTSFEGATYIYSDYASSPIYFNADIYLSMTPDLTNYVKNDDFAQNSSINGGVVRYANGVYGIRNVQNGYIGIVKPTDAEIEAQSTGWRVLTPAQLSKAVKEGVTNNSITLTATEKDNIRKWLGVERSWKKIRTVTIPSDDYKGQTIDGVFYNYEGENGIKNFSFHTDSDGNSLEGKGITGYVLRVTPTTNINVNQAFIGVVGNSMIIYTTNIKNTTSVFWYEFGIGPTFVGKTNNNPGQYQMGNRMNLGKELTSFIFNGFEATSVLGEGSKFEIWGYGYWD